MADRLGEAFGDVEPVDYASTFDPTEQWRMGLVEPADRDGEVIFVCRQRPRETRTMCSERVTG